MTREEEIKRHAAIVGLKFRDSAVINGLNRQTAEIISVIAQTSAIDGAEWADEHPQKGLVEINKIYIWLNDFIEEHYIESHVNGNELTKKEIFDSLNKAIEE